MSESVHRGSRRSPSPTRLVAAEKCKVVPAEPPSSETWRQPQPQPQDLARQTLVRSGITLSPRRGTAVNSAAEPMRSQAVDEAFAITPERQQELDAKLKAKIERYMEELRRLQENPDAIHKERVLELKAIVSALTTTSPCQTSPRVPASTTRAPESTVISKKTGGSIRTLGRPVESSGSRRQHKKRHTLVGEFFSPKTKEMQVKGLTVTHETLAQLLRKRDALKQEWRECEQEAMKVADALGVPRSGCGLPPDKPLSPKPRVADRQPPPPL